MNENHESAYWAVITADVLFDFELSAVCKILFAHITVLQKKEGYCYASNSYFAQPKILNCAKETVSRQISQLEKKGYIKTQIVYKADGKTIDKRLIYVVTIPFHHTINTPIDAEINTPIDAGVKGNNTSSNNTSSNLFLSGKSEKREICKNKKKEEDFSSFRKKILKEYLGKNLIQGPEGFNSTAIISVSKTGYLHNNTSQKDLSSNDAIDVWGWIFVNQDRIGVFDYDCPTPVVAACKAPAAPKTEKVDQVDIPTQQEPKRAPERTNVTWDEVLKKGFYFRTADDDIFITVKNIKKFEQQMLEKFRKNLRTPQNLKKFFVTDEYSKDAIFEYLADLASSMSA